MTISKMHWRGLARPAIESLLTQFDPLVHGSAEERAWLDAAPVGLEFGSQDFERLSFGLVLEDALKLACDTFETEYESKKWLSNRRSEGNHESQSIDLRKSPTLCEGYR